MGVLDRFMKPILMWGRPSTSEKTAGEPQMIAKGWDRYAKNWKAKEFRVVPGSTVTHLGDEWTGEDISIQGTTYGVDQSTIQNFPRFLEREILDKYFPAQCNEGLEIGPGGGRFTSLLLPRTGLLHAADPSEGMLERLRTRFGKMESLRTYITDGMTLPPLKPGSLDFVASFDVFVHFEPRLVFWYLRQIKPLLKAGGLGVIHYASAITPIGWRQFEADLEGNVRQRASFCAFGTMCPQLMERFLKALDLQVISLDLGIIPRDAITVFRNRS